MESNQLGLRVGLVNFHEPTLLLIGDASSFTWLAGQLEIRCPLLLEAEPGNEIRSLSIEPSQREGRAFRSGPVLKWQISAHEAVLAAGRLRELAAHPSPAHAYLGPEFAEAGVQIVASKGEYDPARVFGAQ